MEMYQDEKIIIDGVANPLNEKGLVLRNGHGILTDKRFIFCKHSIAKTLAIGLLINATQGHFEYDITLENIKNIEFISKGIRGTWLLITTKDDNIHRFAILKPEEWEAAFNKVLSIQVKG